MEIFVILCELVNLWRDCWRFVAANTRGSKASEHNYKAVILTDNFVTSTMLCFVIAIWCPVSFDTLTVGSNLFAPGFISKEFIRVVATVSASVWLHIWAEINIWIRSTPAIVPEPPILSWWNLIVVKLLQIATTNLGMGNIT